MKVHGQCHCGDIAFEADVDASAVTLCHCTDCQVLTGTAYRTTVRAPAAGFVLLRGQPTTYVKTGDSGRQRVHGFCGRCGTPLWSAAPGTPSSYGLRVGCLAERRALAPARQIWCRSALPWSGRIDMLPGQATE